MALTPSIDELLLPSTEACKVLTCSPHQELTYHWHVPSKSLSIRGLILASLAQGTSTLSPFAKSQDTEACMDALTSLGVSLSLSDDQLTVKGCGVPLNNGNSEVYVGGSGITLRFLIATLMAGSSGQYILTGNDSLKQRGSGPLINAVSKLSYGSIHAQHNSPPITLRPQGLGGGTVCLPATGSSQFLSALLMAAPLADSPITISLGHLDEPPHGASYIRLTLEAMAAFGITAEVAPNLSEFHLKPSSYQSCDYLVELDMSSLCYLWMWAALHGVTITVSNFHHGSLQGDKNFLTVLNKMGCQIDLGQKSMVISGPNKLRGGFEIGMQDMPDQMLTLAALAAVSSAPITMKNIGVVRNHECDRIAAAETVLKLIGCRTESTTSSLTVWPMDQPPKSQTLPTMGDHRVAMSFAVLASKLPCLQIKSPWVVAKTFPAFYHMLADLGCRYAKTEH